MHDAGDGRRAANAAAVLRVALDHGPVARSTVARLTGLSGAAVSRQLAEAGRLREPHFPDVLAALDADEPWAIGLLRHRARLVGRAAALLIDVLNPEILVVCEAATARRPDLAADVHAEVASRSHVCAAPERTVVAGSFPTSAPAVAAGSVVLDETYAHPLDTAAVRGR